MTSFAVRIDTLPISVQIPAPSLESAEPSVSQQMTAHDPTKAARAFNYLSLQQVLSFDIQTYWPCFTLYDCCLLALVKLFSDFYAHPLAPNTPVERKKELLASLIDILLEIERSNNIDVLAIKQFFLQMRSVLGLGPEFTSQANIICNLLSQEDWEPPLPKESCQALDDFPALYEARAMGLVFLNQIQEAFFAIMLPEREKQKRTLQQWSRNLQRAENFIANSKSSADEKRIRKNVRTNADITDDIRDIALKEALSFNKDFSELPGDMFKAFKRLLKYQEISIAGLECSLDPNQSPSEKGCAVVDKMKKLEVFSKAAHMKCEELLELAKRRSLSSIEKIGPYAEEEDFKEIFRDVLYQRAEAQFSYMTELETFFNQCSPNLLEKVDLQNLAVFLESVVKNLFCANFDAAKLAQWKAIAQRVSPQKYNISEELYIGIIEAVERARATFEQRKKLFEQKYEFSLVPKISDPKNEFEALKWYINKAQKNPSHSSNLERIRFSFKETVDFILTKAVSDEVFIHLQEGVEEIGSFKSFRRNIEATLIARRDFARCNYMSIGFFQPFFSRQIAALDEAHSRHVNEQFDLLKPTPIERKRRPLPSTVASSSPVISGDDEDEVEESSSPAKENVAIQEIPKPEVSPFDQFFLSYTGMPSSVMSQDVSSFTQKQMQVLQRVFHLFLYITSEELLQERVVAESEMGWKDNQQAELLVSSCLHAVHMTTESALTQLYAQVNQGCQLQSHDLFYLARTLLPKNSSVLKIVRETPFTNLMVRYPYAWSNSHPQEGNLKIYQMANNQEIPSTDLLSAVQSTFHEMRVGVQDQAYTRLKLSFPNPDVLRSSQLDRASEKNSPDFAKALNEASEQLALVLKKLKQIHSEKNEMGFALQDCVQHLQRIESSLQLLKAYATQRNYLFFVHQMTSAVQHSFELISYAYSCNLGVPYKGHNLEQYVSLLDLQEDSILSSNDVEILLQFNTKKGLDYPLVSLREHTGSCKYSHRLWEAFRFSFQAICYGEGFTGAKERRDLKNKYQILVQDIQDAITVIKKLVALVQP